MGMSSKINGLDVVSGWLYGKEFVIVLADDSEIWNLSPSEFKERFEEARGYGKYVRNGEILSCVIGTYKPDFSQIKDGLLYGHITVDTVNEFLDNPLITDEEKILIKLYLNEYEEIIRIRESKRSIGKSIKSNVIFRDKSHCRYCGKKLERHEIYIDHVIPYSLGGKTEINNLVVSCWGCNIHKSGKTPEQAGLVLLEAE